MLTALSFDSYISLSNFIHTVNNFFEKVFQLFMLTVLSFDSHISLSNFTYTVNMFFSRVCVLFCEIAQIPWQ